MSAEAAAAQIAEIRRAQGIDPPAASNADRAMPPAPAERTLAEVGHALQQVRSLRGRRERDLTIERVLKALQREAETTHRRLGALIDLWQRHVPEVLAEQTTLTSVRAGTLYVQADSSSVSYELDRLLRGGLLATLRSEYRGTLSRVRVTAAPPRPAK